MDCNLFIPIIINQKFTPMLVIPLLLKEFDEEVPKTRKMLALVPADQFDYKPHQKSMTMRQLTVHLAELPSWIAMGLHTSEIDFAAQPYEPTPAESTDDLLKIFDKAVKEGREAMANAKEEDLLPTWTMRMGEQVLAVMTKYEVIRHAFSQTTHHRAQLGVYLRLLHIPIPGTYGPSADDQAF